LCPLPLLPTPLIYALSLHDALPISELLESRHIDRAEFGERVGEPGDLPLQRRRFLTFLHRRRQGGLVCARFAELLRELLAVDLRDRKSTRLNSSHGSISYAVFCLKT